MNYYINMYYYCVHVCTCNILMKRTMLHSTTGHECAL